jgi:hypothetical protein
VKLLVAALLAVCAATAGSAFAQLRTIPADAKLGKMTHLADMTVEIDGKRARLSPGAQIRSVSNTLVLPMSLPRDSVVRYQLDGAGQVHRAWILSPREAAQAEKAQ